MFDSGLIVAQFPFDQGVMCTNPANSDLLYLQFQHAEIRMEDKKLSYAALKGLNKQSKGRKEVENFAWKELISWV